MNTPNRPHEDLDADERELARVVRALPGNEPPPTLDLRILRAAQDAVSTPSGKRTRRALWASSTAGSFWGFGTAAAAVLAVGVSWQMFMRAPSGNLPASAPAVIAKDDAQDRDSTSVDFVTVAPESDQGRASDRLASAAPATSRPTPERQRPAAVAEPMREESKALAAPQPQPFPDEHVAETDLARAREQPQAGNEQYSRDLRADASAAKSAEAENAPSDSAANAMAAPAAATESALAQKPAAPPPPAERRENAAMQPPAPLAKTADSAGLIAGGAAAPAGEAQAQSKQADEESWDAARHRVRLDARLYPESWILKIRSRLKHGDVIGARASLKLFIEHYPHESVPSNLKPLLDE